MELVLLPPAPTALATSDEAAVAPPVWALLTLVERDPRALLAPPSLGVRSGSEDADVSSPLGAPPLADAVPLASLGADPAPPLEHPAAAAVIATPKTKRQAPAGVREPIL